MNQLKQIHANTLRNGVDFSTFLIGKLIQIPNISYAHKVFDQIPQPNALLYNKLIQAYSIHGPQHQCLSVYSHMLSLGPSPTEYTYTSLFIACSSLRSLYPGEALHSRFLKTGFEFDVFSVTALVDMYAKMGHLGSARKVFESMRIKDVPAWNSLMAGYTRVGDMDRALELFDEMEIKNVVSWTAMVSGYAQNGQYSKALDTYLKMEGEKEVRPNAVTIASVLPACANLGALEVGQRIEEYARNKGYLKNMFVCNALLETYCKCGRIDIAERVFDEIGSRRDVCSWNTMIMGYAVHGKCDEALQLFEEMQIEKTAPDDVTLVGVLMACTHGGMVKKGREIFQSMELKFSIVPKLEHYGCIINLLGRSGELYEAYKLVENMPMAPDSVIWGTLLGACSFHGNVELAEKAAESLFELEPNNPGNYVIMSNIYASDQRWTGVAKLRKMMKGGLFTKAAGYSFVEEGGRIHKFIVEDRSHPKSLEIYAILDEISSKLKLIRNAKEYDSHIEEMSCIQ